MYQKRDSSSFIILWKLTLFSQKTYKEHFVWDVMGPFAHEVTLMDLPWSWATKLRILVNSVQLLSRVQLFATPRIAARHASRSITISRSSLRLTSIESVMPSSHLILCRPIFLLPPIPPSIRVFSNESTLHMRWPKYWSFSFSIIPSKELTLSY